MPTQPIMRKVKWAPSQILLKFAPNVPLWECNQKSPSFRSKFQAVEILWLFEL